MPFTNLIVDRFPVLLGWQSFVRQLFVRGTTKLPPFHAESLVIFLTDNVREHHGQWDGALHVGYWIHGLQQLPSSVLEIEAFLNLVATGDT